MHYIFRLPVKMPKAFGKDIQQLICSLINYFERERDAGGPLLPLNAVREVTII